MRKFLETRLFFFVLAAVFFLPFLGGVHLFDWDEINFAEIAREMVVLQNYLEIYINYETFTEKPPFFMWLQAASMNLFGISDYAARFPNALFGLIALPVLFTIGKKLHSARFGFYWALAWFGSILPHLYFKSGIIDPVFNFFIFLGVYFVIRYVWVRNGKHQLGSSKNIWFYLAFSGLFIGLAILTKGPVAYLLLCLTLFVYWAMQRFKWFITIPHFIFLSGVALVVVMIWAGLNYLQHGPKFIIEFTIRQWTMLTTPDAGHGGFFGYHFIVLIIGCFPASIFAVQAMVKRDHNSNSHQKDMRRWMLILFWVVLILFTLVSTKIVHYSSMAYYPLTYLAAISLVNLEENHWRATGLLRGALWLIGGLAALVTIALPFLGMNIERFKPLFQQDPFALENLNAQVNWTGFESFAGVFLLAILVFSLVVKWKKKHLRFKILFFGMGAWMMLTLVLYIGKIESISQRAAVEFWEQRQGEDCYVTTFDYKSYAHIYYARSQPPKDNSLHSNQKWLLSGEIDKPVYISCKVTSRERLENELEDEVFLYSKNGFYFYKRVPAK